MQPPAAGADGEWLLGRAWATATYLLPHAGRQGAAAARRPDGRVTVSTAGHEMAWAPRYRRSMPPTGGRDWKDVSFRVRRQYAAVGRDGRRLVADRGHGGGGGRRRPTPLLAPGPEARPGNDSPLGGLRPAEVVARDLGQRGGLAHAKDRRGTRATPRSWRGPSATPSRPRKAARCAGADEVFHALDRREFAEVGVNAVTGEVRVRRFLGRSTAGESSTPRRRPASSAADHHGDRLGALEETLFRPALWRDAGDQLRPARSPRPVAI